MFLTGINTAVAPVYLSEIAPIRLRGALGVLNQLGIVTGILVGLIFGLEQVHIGNVRPSERVRLKNANYAKISGEIVRLERPIVR